MATTTVRLDDEEEGTLDELAAVYGGRSNALRAGIRLLAAENQRRVGLAEFLTEWEREDGPVSDTAVEAMTRRYHLDS